MVKLLTEPAEAASGTGRVPGVGNVRPAVHDISGPANILQDVFETKNERAVSKSLAGLAYDLLDPSAVDAELRDQGFGGLTEEQAAALTAAGTDMAKFKGIVEQRGRSRSASLRRLSRQRQFIAENPLLVEEALTIYGNTTGEAPGQTLEDLELDALGLDAIEANPVLAYQQGIMDAAVQQGLSPTLPFDRLEQSVLKRRQVLSTAEFENARWQTVDSRAKVDEENALNHFMTGTYPVFVDETLKEFSTLEIPESSADKEALIRELEKEFTEVWSQYDQFVGIRGQKNQAYTLAKASMRSFLDVKIAEINGETLTDIEKNFHDRLQFASDNLYNAAEFANREKRLITVNGQPVSGADLEVAMSRYQNMDIEKALKLSIGGVKIEDLVGQSLAQMGVPIDMGTTAIRDYTSTQAEDMFNFAIGTARDVVRGTGFATAEEAVNGMKSYFDNYNNAASVPEQVQRTVLDTLADPEVSRFLISNGYHLLDQTLIHTSDYASNTIRVFNTDLEDFDAKVQVSETEREGNLPLVSVSFTPKGGTFGGSSAEANALRRAHKKRIESLIQARILWIGGTAQEALDSILEGVSGRQYFNRPKSEEDTE